MNTSHAEDWSVDARDAAGSAHGFLNGTSAVPIAIALWVVISVGDYITTAEVGFTLLYLVPIGVAVWWRGIRSGLVLCALSTTSFLCTWIATTTPTTGGLGYPFVLVWNLAGEVGVYLVFAFTLHGLRKRLHVEMKERDSAVVQLRHADRLTTVGMLASEIAHELGTPLTVIAGRASLIASRWAYAHDAQESAEIIVRQTDRMSAIIGGLLAFARRREARTTSVDLDALVRETVALLEPLAKKQKCEVVVESHSPNIVPGNAGEIQQVLTNLIMNAVQAMPNGGTVRVTLEHGPVKRAARHGLVAKSYVQIHVRDEGTGIHPSVLPRIFDPFFTTKDVGTGTGLGLSVTFGIVRDHGGWIDVSTALGEGTELVVYLPQ